MYVSLFGFRHQSRRGVSSDCDSDASHNKRHRRRRSVYQLIFILCVFFFGKIDIAMQFYVCVYD